MNTFYDQQANYFETKLEIRCEWTNKEMYRESMVNFKELFVMIAMNQTIAVEFISRCFRHTCLLFWQLGLAKQDKGSIQRLLKTKDNLVVFLWIREVLMIDSTNLVSVS